MLAVPNVLLLDSAETEAEAVIEILTQHANLTFVRRPHRTEGAESREGVRRPVLWLVVPSGEMERRDTSDPDHCGRRPAGHLPVADGG
jgi:hypothetical protein